MIRKDLTTNEVKTYYHNMMNRCYGKNKKTCYDGCSVCEEWKNDFEAFYTWVQENYYEVEGEKMCLDKDILIKGNKVYSPDTCVFVPAYINNMMGGISSKNKKNDLPIGVKKQGSRYKVDVTGCIDSYDTVEQAFNAYKKHREGKIISVADSYIEKHKIPYKLYKALCDYSIDMND